MHLLVGLVTALALQLPMAPRPQVSHVDLAVSLTQLGGHVDVVVRYRLQLQAGADDIPVHTIAFLGAQPTELRAFVDEHPAEAKLNSSKLSGLSGLVRLPFKRTNAGVANLELRYRVDSSVHRNGNVLDVTVPVLLVSGDPTGSPEDFLVARVQLPAEHVIAEFFPTVPRSVERSGGMRTYTLALQTVPAMIRWHSRIGDPPLVPFGLMVDLLTISALVVLSIFTYRVLRAA